MMNPGFLRKWLMVVAGTLALALCPWSGVFCQGMSAEGAEHHNQQGLAYFQKGFYEHAPKSQAAEAERNYGLAVREFKAAIAQDAAYAEAHRNLARVYFVQKNFAGAAQEYRRVTELASHDLDAYVNLALALLELNRTDQAIQALEEAKTHTAEPGVLQTLDGYIAKVRDHQGKEVR